MKFVYLLGKVIAVEMRYLSIDTSHPYHGYTETDPFFLTRRLQEPSVRTQEPVSLCRDSQSLVTNLGPTAPGQGSQVIWSGHSHSAAVTRHYDGHWSPRGLEQEKTLTSCSV